jgi:hypothetical protein
VKAVCPLCKGTFKAIIHNVRSDSDYDKVKHNNVAYIIECLVVDPDPEFLPFLTSGSGIIFVAFGLGSDGMK